MDKQTTEKENSGQQAAQNGANTTANTNGGTRDSNSNGAAPPSNNQNAATTSKQVNERRASQTATQGNQQQTKQQNPPPTAGGNVQVSKNNNQTKNNAKSSGKNDSNTTITIGHYILGKHLGKGTFGQVKLGQHTLTGEKVAIKILEKDKIHDQKDVERITREIKILKKVRHPNVIQLYEIIETEKELYMIMEYCNGGELFDYIVRHTRLSEKQACKFYLELISGIEYIHQSGVCHRDLKPENLLLDYDLTLKIVDFGLSNMYEQNATLKTACGSPCYAAPEMIAGKRYHGLKTDIWSSGVVFYAMVCGYLPFEDPKTSNLYKKIMGAEYTLPKFLSGQCKDLIRRILNTDPETRFTVNDIRNHTWSLQVKDRNRDMGLFPGKEKMPVEDKLFNKLLDEYNFDRKYAQKCIEDNRHNHITACYHLIDKRNKKIKDRQESYQLSKIDFKKKMRMGNTAYDPKQQMTIDAANKTVINNDRNASPNYTTAQPKQVDLNMTAPIHSEQVKNRKINDFVSPNAVGKTRDNSLDYQTIQHGGKNINMQNYTHNERIAAYHRRAQTRGNNGGNPPVAESKSPEQYKINNNLVVKLNDSVVKPVKRENSNTTNATHVTGVTASTAPSTQTKNNAAFYNTQYKVPGQPKGFFPSTTTGANASINMSQDPNGSDQMSQKMSQQKARQQMNMIPPGTAGSVIDQHGNPKQGGRFRSIQGSTNSSNIYKQQQQQAMQNANLNIINQNQNNPNHSIDIGQLPMRLVNQKAQTRKNQGGQQTSGSHHQNRDHRNNQNGLMNGMIPPQTGAKNAWQSIDATSMGNEGSGNINQGLMIQPCSNQAQNLISGPAAKIEINRPSITQGGSSNPGTAGGQRSPRTSAQVKNQFYAVHGRGMNIQNNAQHDANGPQNKGILTKIFKNQHNRQGFHGHQNQNYVDHMNQTQGHIAFQGRQGPPNIINSLKSPNNNLREHLHTQGRTRAQNQTLEPGPSASLGNHQRGGSLNIQDLYSHYQKGQINGQGQQQTGRNVTYYSNKNSQQNHVQHFQQMDQNQQANYMHQAQIKSPNNGQNVVGNQNNIFVPGSMRFAVMNRQQNGGQNGQAVNLTAQQQKIFEMNNHPHQVGAGHPPPMAMSFHKNQAPPVGSSGSNSGNGGNILPANVVPSSHTNNFMNRKKINTQQQNRSHSVNTH